MSPAALNVTFPFRIDPNISVRFHVHIVMEYIPGKA